MASVNTQSLDTIPLNNKTKQTVGLVYLIRAIVAGGFFIEAGSNDGEDYSDSLHFELNRSWQVRT
jgi:hypothetical protein